MNRLITAISLIAGILSPSLAIAAQALSGDRIAIFYSVVSSASGLSSKAESVATMDNILKSQYQSKHTIANEQNAKLKAHMEMMSQLAFSNKVVAAQALLHEIKSTREYQDAKGYPESAIGQIDMFITEATVPPDDDDSFVKAMAFYSREVARYKAWPAYYRHYADVMIKSAVYDDDVAYDYATAILSDKPANLMSVQLSARKVKSRMDVLRTESKDKAESAHAH